MLSADARGCKDDMKSTTEKKAITEKRLIELVAKRIAKLPKGGWEAASKEERKTYRLAAKRALAGIRLAEKHEAARLKRKANRTDAAE